MRCARGQIGGAVLGAALAGLACWVAAGPGSAEEPTLKAKPKTKEAKDAKSAAAVRAQLALTLQHSLRLSVHRHGRGSQEKVRGGAGQEGLEPPTAGFGDRCSTN